MSRGTNDAASRRTASPSGRVIVEPIQIRMARAALNWSVRELAEHAEVGESSIYRLEAIGESPNVLVRTYDKVIRCLEESGIVFLPAEDPEMGPGIRARRP